MACQASEKEEGQNPGETVPFLQLTVLPILKENNVDLKCWIPDNHAAGAISGMTNGFTKTPGLTL